MSMRNLVLTAATVAALVAVFWIAGSGGSAQAADDQAPPAISATIAPQTDDAAEDDRVSVQLWTALAAAGAAALGLVALTVRVVMGWVKPPPPQEESPH